MTENKRIKVLITPAGSRMAVPAIRFLKKDKDIQIIAADVDPLAPGLYLADKSYIVAPFTQEKFIEDLTEIVKKEKVDVIIPALDPLLIKFAQLENHFLKLGAKILISSLKTIKLCEDKWSLYQFLKNDISMPKSFIRKEDINISYPLFVKPCSGSGSLSAFKIISKSELDFYYQRIKKPIIQEYLGGKEYTVDCLADMKGELLFSLARERVATRAGVSVKMRIIENETLRRMALKISEKIRFKGPFLFQAKEKKGKFFLIEINPRIGGGMCSVCYAGLNIYSTAVKILMNQEIKIPQIKRDFYLTCYEKEIFCQEKKIDSIVKTPRQIL